MIVILAGAGGGEDASLATLARGEKTGLGDLRAIRSIRILSSDDIVCARVIVDECHPLADVDRKLEWRHAGGGDRNGWRARRTGRR